MRKNLLKILTCGRAAILTCGLAVTLLSACSSDDDPNAEAPQEQADVQMTYAVEVTDDVLKVADVEVNYVDQTGAKQKEVMTSTTWKKTLNAKTLPLTEGLWAKLTPKGTVESGDYFVRVKTSATYEAKLANSQTTSGGFGTDPTASVSFVQTPEHVAAWCATSPTIGFAVDKNGNATKTSVDFGGNSNDSEVGVLAFSPWEHQGALIFNDPVLGQIIGSDGRNYYYDKLPSGVTPVAKICYINRNEVTGVPVFFDGLALALDEEEYYDWDIHKHRKTMQGVRANGLGKYKEPQFIKCSWKMPDEEEWNTLIETAGGFEKLRDGFESVGGINMTAGNYWSSTRNGRDDMWAGYKLYNFEWGGWTSAPWRDSYYHARLCLKFLADS